MSEEIRELQCVVDTLLSGRSGIKVLEAGCGSCMHIQMPKDAFVVGIDVSEKQLRKNFYAHEKILGDIQYYEPMISDFDLIICWTVLEHLPQPERALKNFLRGIKDMGLIVLALPNVLSIKGLITKYTPYWFHVLVYRYLYGKRFAGEDEAGPFPTFLRFSMKPTSIKRFAAENGLSIEYFSMCESRFQKQLKEKYQIVNHLWRIFEFILKTVTCDRISGSLTECIFVLQRRG